LGFASTTQKIKISLISCCYRQNDDDPYGKITEELPEIRVHIYKPGAYQDEQTDHINKRKDNL
jgi:hypothetical protein